MVGGYQRPRPDDPPKPTAGPATAAAAAAAAAARRGRLLHPELPPSRSLPLRVAMARSASSTVDISTNPNPRDWPVSRSVTTAADSTWPACCERLPQLLGRRRERQSADEQFLRHGVLLSGASTLWTAVPRRSVDDVGGLIAEDAADRCHPNRFRGSCRANNLYDLIYDIYDVGGPDANVRKRNACAGHPAAETSSIARGVWPAGRRRRMKLPVSLQIVFRALIEEGLKRPGDPALLANVGRQAETVRRIRSEARRRPETSPAPSGRPLRPRPRASARRSS